MSNESENKKDLSVEVSDASGDKVEDDANTSEDSQDTVNAQTDKNEEKDSVNDSKESEDSKLDEETPAEPEEKIDNKENDENEDDKDAKNKKPEKGTKKESKNSKSEDETENGEAEEEEEEEPVKVKADAPVKKAGKKGATLPNKTRETPETQKKVNKAKVAEVADTKEDKAVAIEGKGAQLGEIPRVDASISRFKNDDLKLLYRLLFKTPGKTALIAKSIKKFNGFGFKKESEDYTKKLDSTKKFELKQLKSICEMLDLDKKGTKDEIAERILDFLIEPKDSGKQTDGGRPKRTAAVRANNRGYSSHDDSYSSDERRASRGRRGKGKRVNLKDDTTSESDQEFHLSDTSEPKARSVKRKKTAPKPVSDEENISDADDPSSDESDVDGKKRKTKKVANNKPNPPKPTPGRRGRKPAAETEKKPATPKKPVGRKRALSEESDAAPDENGSSSEDEPLIKKAKSPQPPTDEEIKKYVKEILEGANLEEITMKTVCKQVYAHYPDFDLAHKKDFIKATVKSLIST